MIDILLLLLGIALLTAGGEALIRGALGIASHTGLSPLLVGLVIVGFGTSTPEMVVSLDAVLGGHPDIAVGNVVGSNIANILLILGLCAVVTPLGVTVLGLRRDAVTVIVISVIFIVMARDGAIGRLDGAGLLLLLVAYLTWAYLTERGGASPAAPVHQAEADAVEAYPSSIRGSLAMALVGLILLIVGSRVALSGAIGIAKDFGVSESLIGLTLVAAGTSLPELTISFIAALRRQADVAVGNILGSNIFNLLAILGVSASVRPVDVAGRIAAFDQWVMLAAAICLFAALLTGRRINRFEGAALLAGYVVYVAASYAGSVAV